MSRSQRWKSKREVAQAVVYMDKAKDVFLRALKPYFESFPDKQKAAEGVIFGMDAIKAVIEESFSDI